MTTEQTATQARIARIAALGATEIKHRPSDDPEHTDDAIEFNYRGFDCEAQIEPRTDTIVGWNVYQHNTGTTFQTLGELARWVNYQIRCECTPDLGGAACAAERDGER